MNLPPSKEELKGGRKLFAEFQMKNQKKSSNINLNESNKVCIVIHLRNSKKVIEAYKQKLKEEHSSVSQNKGEEFSFLNENLMKVIEHEYAVKYLD